MFASVSVGYLGDVPSTRLDTLLYDRGLFPSRSRAAAAIMAGEVRIGPQQVLAEKPGQQVSGDLLVEVAQRPRFVSRGGEKLRNALDHFGLDVSARAAIDVGASTGGFSDCLLQAGVARVIALDVGYGELDWSLRCDDRVSVIERTNARHLGDGDLPFRPDLAVCDVSFISLCKVLPAIVRQLADRHDVLAMVKPQFEVGKGRVGSGGVVRDPALRREAIESVAEHMRVECGSAVLGAASSGLPGPKGNRETFLWLAERGRPGALDQRALATLLDSVEPAGESA